MKPFPLLLISAALFSGLANPGRCIGPTVLPKDINVEKSLVIRDHHVVERWSGARPGNPGPFTLERLLAGLSPKGDPKPALLEWLNSWVSVQKDSDQKEQILPIGRCLLDRWKKLDNASHLTDAAWKPNFAHAPFRLLAIVYRPDLWKEDQAGKLLSGGEGRFVFCVIEDTGGIPHTTINFEYLLPAKTEAEAKRWAERWFALSKRPAFDDSFCKELALLTSDFTRYGAMPGRPKGSALGQIRTNERNISETFVQGAAVWNLREFSLNPVTGAIMATTTKQAPGMEFAESQTLVDYLKSDVARILKDRHHVPATFQQRPFLGQQANVPHSNLPVWLTTPALRQQVPAEVIHHFALNTCNGCHGIETRTDSYHIKPRPRNSPAELSSFLKDPAPGGEMAERRAIMAAILNGVPADVIRWEEAVKKQLIGRGINLPALLQKRASRVH